jgi:uncharacterized protein YrzB (UPF0473 family)
MADKIVNDNTIDEDDIVTLLNDKGEEVDFYHVATIDYKKNWYVFLKPAEVVEDIAEDEVLIFRLGEDEKGEETLLPIDSEEELNGVYEEYLKEMENDNCCECGHNHEECDCGCDECN